MGDKRGEALEPKDTAVRVFGLQSRQLYKLQLLQRPVAPTSDSYAASPGVTPTKLLRRAKNIWSCTSCIAIHA